MTPKIVLLNGPPYSGKDTIARHLLERTPPKYGVIMKFATPLKTIVRDFFCFGDQKLFDFWDSPANKDKPTDQFLGRSCRDCQIGVSEGFFKPTFGQDVFGKILARDIARTEKGIYYISDSGFRPEAEVLVKKFGAENVILVNLERDNTSFKGDSRGYINLDDLEVTRLTIHNNEGSSEKTAINIREIIYPIAKEYLV